ncbi:MAG: tRNA uridine-5-carboxymethylaminomethyl(34) synthesis enzyme MnmG, partial [Proteobacteria bacterium]|nr:tRNA uridine-5-carboxymethylaminomethyl(34) synthesis enzyme MnmG [Pseudomonadota bacterium]
FTSRAEYRLQLREDNADLRLTETARKLGLIDDQRWSAFSAKQEGILIEQRRLDSIRVLPGTLPQQDAIRVLGKGIEREYTLTELLKRPDVTYASLMTLPGAGEVVANAQVAEQVEIQAKYHGYIQRQQEEVARQAQYEHTLLPKEIDYRAVKGLSSEVQQKLNQHKPETVGQAARISGVTPAAISLLLVHLKRGFAANDKKQSA